MKTILSFVIAAGIVAQASAQTPAPTPVQQAEIAYRQGLAAEKAGDPAAAQKAYTAALLADPNHANARYSLGQLKLTAGSIATKGREAKFGAVMVPEFRLDAATLQESLDALRVIVERQSKNEVEPNFIIQDPQQQLAPARISLNLKNMPAKGVLQYLMEQAGAKARHDEHAIVIVPKPK
jgi:tetratricopeptide (TPR) repeat protein